MTVKQPSLQDLAYTAVSLYAMTVLVTLYRLYLRYRRKNWWWDETFALTGMVVMVLYVIGSIMLPNVAGKPRGIQITAYYLLTPGFYIPIWSARLSILFTIIRMSPWPSQRRILVYIGASFIVLCIFLHAQVLWTCEIQYPEWKKIDGAFCDLHRAVPITQITTSLLSDVVLILLPLWVLRTLSDKGLRFRLFSLFSVSILTTVAAFGHSLCVIIDPGVLEAIFAAIEVSTAVTICNFSVIIPTILGRFSSSDKYADAHEGSTRVFGGTNEPTKLSTVRFAEFDQTTLPEIVVSMEEDMEHGKYTAHSDADLDIPQDLVLKSNGTSKIGDESIEVAEECTPS